MEINNLNQITGLLVLKGNLNIDLEDGIQQIPVLAKRQGLKNLILDFQMMDHMNSDAAMALVKLSTYARREKIRLFEHGLTGEYREVFLLTGLDEYLPSITEITDINDVLPDNELRKLGNSTEKTGNQDAYGWVKNVARLNVSEKPEGSLNKNVNNRKVIGPLQGFGQLWEKRYLLDIESSAFKPEEIITTMKQHFPEFQPSVNRFYPSSKGIVPGEVVLIDSKTPGGVVSTGVLVLYVDDTSFSLMTPQGHPESGWVTFSAVQDQQSVEVMIRGVARASDPFFELAFAIAGSKLQESIWTHVLSSLAGHLGVDDNVRMQKSVLDTRLQWMNSMNLWYNAQIRSLPFNFTYRTHKDQENG